MRLEIDEYRIESDNFNFKVEKKVSSRKRPWVTIAYHGHLSAALRAVLEAKVKSEAKCDLQELIELHRAVLRELRLISQRLAGQDRQGSRVVKNLGKETIQHE